MQLLHSVIRGDWLVMASVRPTLHRQVSGLRPLAKIEIARGCKVPTLVSGRIGRRESVTDSSISKPGNMRAVHRARP